MRCSATVLWWRLFARGFGNSNRISLSYLAAVAYYSAADLPCRMDVIVTGVECLIYNNTDEYDKLRNLIARAGFLLLVQTKQLLKEKSP